MKHSGLTSKVSYEVRSCNRCLILRALKGTQDKERNRTRKRGGIAQLGEHLLCKQGVNGSIPFVSTRHSVQKLLYESF